MVTGRSEVDIDHALQDLVSRQMCPGKIDHDIALWIPRCVSIVVEPHDIAAPVRLKAIEDTLLQEGISPFIWIRMMTDYLAHIPNVASVMEARVHFPDDLKRLYVKLLQRVAENLSKQARRKQMAYQCNPMAFLWAMSTFFGCSWGSLVSQDW